ncbi:MAG: hypothetical protein RLZ57_170 [Actinomycetota bacterium]|jgi:hypothetical protein
MKFDFLTDTTKRKTSARIWFALVFTWALIRALLVYKFFAPHGVNPIWYFVIDIASSIPYAIYSARLVFAFVDQNRPQLISSGLITLISFYLPDVYVFIFANEIPRVLLISFVGWILLFSALAIIEIARNIRRGKAQR